MSTQHKGHEYLKLEELFNKSKERIGKDREELENISPTYEEIAIELENQIANLDGEYEKLTTEMTMQREELHREIDNAFNQMVLNTIDTGHEKLRSVACLIEEQIWTCGVTADIKCFNIQGVLQKTIQTKSRKNPSDIAVYKDGALLYSDWKTKKVYKVKDDQTEEIIRLQGWLPGNLCVTSSGELLVIMLSENETQAKVVRYSGSTVKQTIQFNNDQPLYSGNKKIKYITENRNLDICVTDWGAGAVVVVNQAGKLRFRYTGHPLAGRNERFKPSGITTDSQSHILTSDLYNHCIHILQSDGQFLRYIDNCDLKSPYGLCVDSNGRLFLCELFRGSVKKIKYII
ncbi:uncharacterized protein LOC144617991 [Crassostrea virginica]